MAKFNIHWKSYGNGEVIFYEYLKKQIIEYLKISPTYTTALL